MLGELKLLNEWIRQPGLIRFRLLTKITTFVIQNAAVDYEVSK